MTVSTKSRKRFIYQPLVQLVPVCWRLARQEAQPSKAMEPRLHSR